MYRKIQKNSRQRKVDSEMYSSTHIMYCSPHAVYLIVEQLLI